MHCAIHQRGLPNNEVFAKANYPEAGSGLMSQSVGEAPSMAAQTAAGLLQRYHVLNTNDVSGLLMTQAIPRQTDAGTVKASRPANIILPEHKDGVGKLPPHLGSGSDHSSHTITAHRGKSIPADAIQRSSLYTPPVKVLTPSAAVQLAQEAESLSRRASLAAKLHRMAESADARSARASESSDGVSIKASLHASQASSPAHITSSSDGYQGKSMPLVAEQYLPKQRTSLDKVSRADAGQGADPSAEQTSNAVNSKAAGVRRLHLTSSNNREKSGYSKPLSGMTSEDSIQHSNKDLHVAGAQAAEGSGMQAGQAPVLRRTLSDAAAEALDVVESVQCPIIPYTQLQIQRKIGDGSIGQVYLAKWRETDVAVKVITQMQNLASVQGLRPPDPVDMNREGESLPDAVSHMDLSDVDLTAITTLETEVSIMAAIRHPNVAMLMGLCLSPICVVTEFCARGSLTDVLRKAASDPVSAQQLDWRKRITMALDAAKGMLQLHSHPDAILHRDLKSPNLLVDRHWRVKVTDFNLSSMVKSYADSCNHSSTAATNPRWLAPEVVTHQRHSKAADVYSFGIVLWELMTWQLPWDDCNHFQIMMLLTREQARPEIPDINTLPGPRWSGVEGFIEIMQACWHQDPDRRPPFESVIASLRTLLVQTTLRTRRSQEIPSGGGSGMLPDSPRQLTAEACVPLASSVTTLSRSPSSHSHKTHLSSTDPKQETAPKQAPPPETECSLLELATKQMASEHVPNSSLAPNQALVAGSLRSPFEIAAKQMAPDRPPTTSSDVQQEAAPKLAPAAVSAHSPLETTAKQMALQHLLSPRSNSLQEAKPSRHL
ncbi:hypothetical protein ABBQ32_005722 [Trebouxia sp. C0010 RCD-2024]